MSERPLAPLKSALDWGLLAPLRIRSRIVAEGVYAGNHRSSRRGAGVEFGGFRAYTPGDDLRWLDRRSLLRHDHLLIRQFETETDRALRIIVDATESMRYRGDKAPGAKLAFSAVLAAALARIAIANGDPVSLSFIGGKHREEAARSLGVSGGREALERIMGSLESITPFGESTMDSKLVEHPVSAIARTARSGSIVIVLSDFLDLPDDAERHIAGLASKGRQVVLAQTLDPDEALFPFDGTVRLRAIEGREVIETDASITRDGYMKALSQLQQKWEQAIVSRGGRFVRSMSSDDAVSVVRAIVEAVH